MRNFLEEKGFNYKFNPSSCESCGGKCCTGESGYIYLSAKEQAEIATFLDLDMPTFRNSYLYRVGYKYSIKEIKVKESYNCLFFSEGGCQIYDVRPKQCRTFPFWNYYKDKIVELKQECPGIIDT